MELIDKLNPFSGKRLADSIDRLVGTGFYDESDRILLSNSLESSSYRYWNNQLAAHLLISVGTGIDLSGITSFFTSSPLRAGYSLGMAVREALRKDYRKMAAHGLLSIPSLIPKAGGFVYLIPIFYDEPRLMPVYLNSFLRYLIEIFSFEEYKGLRAEKDALVLQRTYADIKGGRANWEKVKGAQHALSDRLDRISTQYLWRNAAEIAVFCGVLGLKAFSDLPPESIAGKEQLLSTAHQLLDRIPEYVYTLGLAASAAFEARDLSRYVRLERMRRYVYALDC